MKPLPIRARLTLWYFSILATGLLAFALIILAALHHAVHRTVDIQLRDHMAAIRRIVREDSNRTLTALHHDLNEDVELAPDLTLLQIWDQDGQIVYRSAAMNGMQVPDSPPQLLDHPVTRKYGHHPLRELVQKVPASQTDYTVMAAIPVHDFVEAIEQVESTLWIAIPLLLLLAAAGGYWVAGRALSPVRSMITAADAIQPGDLAARVVVPIAEDELQQLALTLNRMLGRLQAGFERITRFTADASHELRTPIALLRTRAEVLLRRPRSAEEYRTAIEASLDELEKTSCLLEELMLLARADVGAETLHFADVNLTELVRATAAVAQSLAEAKHLRWRVALPPHPVHVHGDEGALRRLLLVLIDNAVKYTPECGSVQLALHGSDMSVKLEISDTGIGIGEEDLPHIFERFYRADQARTRATGGAGLGLSIAQWIVQKHGGTLTVESTLASGSVFCVTLPHVDSLR